MKPVYGTFGIFRWLLAAAVMVDHLAPQAYIVYGGYAVYAFYILSGYAVTYILKTHYLQIRLGVLKYYANRFMRVYPTYLVVMLGMIPLTKYFRDTVVTVTGVNIKMPTSVSGWLTNFIPCGLQTLLSQYCPPMLVPPAWSLAVEMLWWFLMPMLLRQAHLGKLAYLSLFYTVLMVWGQSKEYEVFPIYMLPYIGNLRDLSEGAMYMLYFAPIAAMLPFIIGMILFARKEAGYRDMSPKAGALVLMLAFPAYVTGGFYTSLFLSTVILYYLSGIDSAKLPRWLAGIDRFLGNLSYPLYVVHLLAGTVILAVFPSLTFRTWPFFAATFVLAQLLSIVLHYTIELLFDRLRRRVRR
jgi:peptidoglycan/LPS O-acetylase OafA/YrhL